MPQRGCAIPYCSVINSLKAGSIRWPSRSNPDWRTSQYTFGFTHTAGTQVFLFFTLALTVGLVALAYGLYRAHAIHWSTAGALAAGAVVLQIAFFVGNTAAWFIVATAILLVALATIGRTVLLETDADWEHTPEFRGFRPAATH